MLMDVIDNCLDTGSLKSQHTIFHLKMSTMQQKASSKNIDSGTQFDFTFQFLGVLPGFPAMVPKFPPFGLFAKS